MLCKDDFVFAACFGRMLKLNLKRKTDGMQIELADCFEELHSLCCHGYWSGAPVFFFFLFVFRVYLKCNHIG